jgi:hypothetical protein
LKTEYEGDGNGEETRRYWRGQAENTKEELLLIITLVN